MHFLRISTHIHELIHTHAYIQRYLTRIVKNDKWTILDSSNETKKLPDGTKCPAYALAARIVNGHKEVVLSIRGSATPMDWYVCMYVCIYVICMS